MPLPPHVLRSGYGGTLGVVLRSGDGGAEAEGDRPRHKGLRGLLFQWQCLHLWRQCCRLCWPRPRPATIHAGSALVYADAPLFKGMRAVLPYMVAVPLYMRAVRAFTQAVLPFLAAMLPRMVHSSAGSAVGGLTRECVQGLAHLKSLVVPCPLSSYAYCGTDVGYSATVPPTLLRGL